MPQGQVQDEGMPMFRGGIELWVLVPPKQPKLQQQEAEGIDWQKKTHAIHILTRLKKLDSRDWKSLILTYSRK